MDTEAVVEQAFIAYRGHMIELFRILVWRLIETYIFGSITRKGPLMSKTTEWIVTKSWLHGNSEAIWVIEQKRTRLVIFILVYLGVGVLCYLITCGKHDNCSARFVSYF